MAFDDIHIPSINCVVNDHWSSDQEMTNVIRLAVSCEDVTARNSFTISPSCILCIGMR